MARPLIAVVDDDAAQRQLLANALERAGYEVRLCPNGEEALLAAPECALMLLDVRMPGMSGLEVLTHVKRQLPALPVILLTAFIDVRDAVAAIKTGALDYLEKPVDLDELIAAVDDALGTSGRPTDTGTVELPGNVVAESPAMRTVFAQAARVAPSGATVLILGESGTGKQVMAEFIHARSPRAAMPLVNVNCAALPEHLVESELFGHEKGAFTGADAQRRGRFEEASGGTIFLDEIGELPLTLQPKLLHVLESGRFRRVGGSDELQVDVRVIAATNRNLQDDVKSGAFREDLYFRLNVFALTLPPLRERRDDVLPLAEVLLRDRKRNLAPATERALMAYDWPGNVRELRNALERASLMASGTLILPTDLPPQVQEAKLMEQPGRVLVGDMQEIQRRAILEALEKTGGNKTRAAALLNISRRNLIYKLREYGV
ncbi:MAG: sigma-54-dependent Fis family transcriptional regulator [Candidatus Hydrogenedentes bacterium]|nr:sigma-54-dependent Fis family transcriptional regulator [Candidatus Hydrogenedentota bacterium]